MTTASTRQRVAPVATTAAISSSVGQSVNPLLFLFRGGQPVAEVAFRVSWESGGGIAGHFRGVSGLVYTARGCVCLCEGVCGVCKVLAGPFDCSSQIYSCLCYCGYLFGLRNCNLNVFNVILVVRPGCLRCLLYLVCLFCLCLNVSCSWLWFQFSLTVNCLLAPDVRLIVEHHRGVWEAGAGAN